MELIKNLPAGARLFSADVEALYPSIPWDESIDAATDFYKDHLAELEAFALKEGMLSPPPPQIFKKILTLVLKKNIFSFQGARYFRQLRGTAMGCSMSVYLANVFMYRRTKMLLDRPPTGLLYLGRFIDDLVGIWTGKDEDVPALFSATVDENIRLTYVYGGSTLDALDVKLSIEMDGSISTSLYRKPTDGAQFLHWSSAHPRKLKESIPFAQLLRLKRNCSKEEDFLIEAKDLFERFRSRGYPEAILTKAWEKASSRSRSDLLITGSRCKAGGEQFTAVLDDLGSARNPIGKLIRAFYSDLQNSPAMLMHAARFGAALPEEPPRIATRAGKSLGHKVGPTYKKPRRAEGE
jgi:hypothetical protein